MNISLELWEPVIGLDINKEIKILKGSEDILYDKRTFITNMIKKFEETYIGEFGMTIQELIIETMYRSNINNYKDLTEYLVENEDEDIIPIFIIRKKTDRHVRNNTEIICKMYIYELIELLKLKTQQKNIINLLASQEKTRFPLDLIRETKKYL